MTNYKLIVAAGLAAASIGLVSAQGPGGVAPGGAAPGRGGRGNPAAPLFAEQCAGCHGTDLGGGRAHSLFDDKWLSTVDDTYLTNTIKNGLPNTEMGGFGASLTDAQVWSLIQYIRAQTGALKPKPPYVADPDGMVIKSEKQTFKIEMLTKDVNTPFGLAFLPDGRLLITERNGTLRILDKNKKLSAPVANMPKAHVQQDGGYLDISLHPDYARNGWIYLSYSEDQPGYVAPPLPPLPPTPPAGGGRGGVPFVPSNTVVVRGKIDSNNEWTNQQLIFKSPNDLYVSSGVHYGSRFLWDKQGHLYFTLGDRGTIQNAQELSNTLGKIHRINDDGTVPKDNPFVNTPGADPTIWSLGHRNPEGLAWDPVSGILWESEHGPSAGDEINIIQKGHNYGWGVATKGTQAGITKWSEPGMDEPIVYYIPSFAPASITFYTGNRYPGWKNTSLFVGGLVGQQLRRFEIKGDKVLRQEVLFSQIGRVRVVLQGPDGLFYIALQSPTGIPNPAGGNIPLSAATPGSIVRLIPVNN
ncbi:MAG TPA: PQQ-dependent sugar dehydrogenase [Vicinamibacterales bacterium]|jgi:glucose/arabinose dehydrogenase|nr:PQQ-dependent sugar dehydrogenase [Vicinamibacterales bacterium]